MVGRPRAEPHDRMPMPHDDAVALTYVRSSDGAVYAPARVRLARVQRSALSDAITPLPPIGPDEASLSTFWIDHANRICQDADDGPVQGGNTTTLVLRGSEVVATSDYEHFEGESMPVHELLDILRPVLAMVLTVRDSEWPHIPATYLVRNVSTLPSSITVPPTHTPRFVTA